MKPPSIAVINTVPPTSTYRGWSSWSLQAFRGEGYGYLWQTEDHVKTQANVIASELSSLGYDRINLDSGWQDYDLDRYGRNFLNRTRFPSGIEHLQSFLAARGLKLGVYYLPGIDARAVKNRLPIMSSKYTADEIVLCPPCARASRCCHRPLANAFDAGFALNYSHPGSQLFINSIVDGLYAWNVSFVKLDGNVPGSSFAPSHNAMCDTRADLAAWHQAVEERYTEWRKAGREKIWLVASWSIPPDQGSVMDRTVNSWRVAQDIEAYGTQTTTFDRVIRNVKSAAPWTTIEQNRQWRGLLDMDALLVSDMTLEESRTMVTLWAMLGSPYYLGDDLTRLPAARKALLKHPEVLALQRLAAMNPARLDRFNATRAMRSEVLLRTSKSDCELWAEKRSLVVGLGGIGKTDLSADLAECLRTRQAQLAKVSVEAEEEGDEWVKQVWVLEVENGEVFVAVVNAGRQAPSDTPIRLEMHLNGIERFQRLKVKAAWYSMSDIWTGEDLGVVGLEAKFLLKLGVHETMLLRLRPLS